MTRQRTLGALMVLVAAVAVGVWVLRLPAGPVKVNGVRLGMTEQEVTEVLGDPDGSERNELDYVRFLYDEGGELTITFRAGRVNAIQGTSINVGDRALVTLGDSETSLQDSGLSDLLGTPVTKDTGADVIVHTWGEPSGPDGQLFILTRDSRVQQIGARGAYDAPDPPPAPPGGGHSGRGAPAPDAPATPADR